MNFKVDILKILETKINIQIGQKVLHVPTLKVRMLENFSKRQFGVGHNWILR